MNSTSVSSRLEQAPHGSVAVWPFPVPNNPRAFLSGDPESERVRLRYFRRNGDHALASLLARAWFGPGSEGPPGIAHGGSQASLLDEAMGGCAWMNGLPVVAARFTIELRKPIPLGSFVLLEAWIEKRENRKVFARAHLLSDDSSTVFCEGEGLFIIIDPATYLPASQSGQVT